MPGSADQQIRRIRIQEHAVPFECQDFFPAKAGIQAYHDEYIGRQIPDRIQKLLDLFVGQ